MTEDNNRNLSRGKNDSSQKFIIAAVIILFLIAVIYFVANKDKKPNVIEQPVKKEIPQEKESYEASYKKEIKTKPAINYDELEKNEDLKKAMQERKKQYDIKNSLDMIVDSDETFKINNIEISMAEILKLAALNRGDVVEENIGEDSKNIDIKQYGIYVVKPCDNIWNIHFNILREYYGLKNIIMDMKADETDKMVLRSVVGKIIKF